MVKEDESSECHDEPLYDDVLDYQRLANAIWSDKPSPGYQLFRLFGMISCLVHGISLAYGLVEEGRCLPCVRDHSYNGVVLLYSAYMVCKRRFLYSTKQVPHSVLNFFIVYTHVRHTGLLLAHSSGMLVASCLYAFPGGVYDPAHPHRWAVLAYASSLSIWLPLSLRTYLWKHPPQHDSLAFSRHLGFAIQVWNFARSVGCRASSMR
eukprot:Blabericola_migrator_1__4611@NODE_2446_length_2747_cov_17_156343_g1530_i0_p2_GENE_NODE_2446_length_2747_cov_17_156343_g1530_i0NODE_2446_length_2747_cov_17_156343_g1530_i0_p2_ORF_typecomplete_len207_score5_95_NODE_2446_length_2747_cov_17_156343_g1530_i020562676